MPYREQQIEKVYWTIGELADECCVATSALRFWEAEQLFPPVPKGKRGNRKYNLIQRKAIKRTVFILHFIGMTLKGYKKLRARGLEDDIVKLYCPI